MKKIIICILLIGIIASCGFIYAKRIYAEEMNDSEMQSTLNDVDTITKDYDFEDDKVIVVMNEAESLKFKNYTPQDFSEVGCIEIVELMPYTSATIKEYIQKYGSLENAKLKIENETLINVNDFRVILSLTLLVKNKENVLSAVDILKQRTDIEAVEPNYIIAYNSMADDNVVHSNEQEYLNCWGNKKIKTKQAHTITKGDPTVYVGIMDTGIDSTHDYLKEALAHDLHKDYTRIDGPLVDTSNHGTTVAGVVASVAPNVKLVSLKIKYSSLMFGLSESIDYAIEKKIGILNFSHGSFEEYSVDTLLAPLKIYKGLFVCAAGNYGNDNDKTAFYPSEYSFKLGNVISVGAIDSDGYRAIDFGKSGDDSSSYGKTRVSVFAPGKDIVTTYMNNTYALVSGTSYAAPYVAGIAALIKSINFDLNGAEIKKIIMDNINYNYSISCKAQGDVNAFEALCAVAYQFNNDECAEIIGVNFEPQGELIIPSSVYKGRDNENQGGSTKYQIKKIGDATFSGKSGIKKVSFDGETGLTEIGKNAFANCVDLETIVLPEGLLCIDDYAFTNCTKLKEVSLDFYSRLQNIGIGVFKGCTNLEEIYIPQKVTSIGNNAFEGCPIAGIGFNATNCKDFTKNDMPFSGITSASVIVGIGNSVTKVPDYLFYSLTNGGNTEADGKISEIYLGTNVTQIGEYAFYDCRQVTDLELPSGLQIIEDYAFYNIGISELQIPTELRYVGQRAFSGASLRSIVVSAGNENYLQGVNCLVRKEDNYLLIGASDGIIPNGVITIGVSAYSGNMLLTSVNIPNTVTVIDHNAFIGCEGLTSVNIPTSVTLINSYAFAGCINLAQITFGTNSALTSIEAKAFMSCAISSVALPQKLDTIGESAFLQTELSSITIPTSVTAIGGAAFSYCDNLETIRLLRPYTNKTYYNFLTTGTNFSSAYPKLKRITVPDIESYSGYYLKFIYLYSDVEDILFIDGATNGQANVGLEYTIQSDGTYIISGYNSNLVGAKVLPTTYNGKPVNKIGSNAFSDCVSLTGVVIPSSITEIGSQAFKDCSGLKAITFNRTAAQGITQIQTDSFEGCSAVEVINVPDEDSFNAYGMQFIDKDMNLLKALMGDVMLI